MPGARCTRGLVLHFVVVERTRVNNEYNRNHPAFPRAMVLRFPSCSPRRSGLFFATVNLRGTYPQA